MRYKLLKPFIEPLFEEGTCIYSESKSCSEEIIKALNKALQANEVSA